jgi:hypothetical protein
VSFALGVDGVVGHDNADTVVMDGGRIVAIGRAGRLGIDADERLAGWAAPPLRDAHIHPSGYAAAVTGLTLDGLAGFAELSVRVREAALLLAPGAPLLGARLDEEGLRERRLPDRHDLDRILSKRPVLLTRRCGHVAVANGSALRVAGIGPYTPDPPGGVIVRDHTGTPTGRLEETAIGLVAGTLAAGLPGPGPDQLLRAIRGLTGLGIGRIHAVVSEGDPMWCGSGDELADLLAIAPDLPIDADVLLTAETPARLEAAVSRIASQPGRVRWVGWKGFADGSLGGHTAALSAPYADRPTTGISRLDPLRHGAMIDTTLALGGVVAIHAIGDAAVGAVLDLYQAAPRHAGSFRIEHASVVSPDLIRRMSDLGVIASVQPAFVASDAPWIRDRVGPERAAWCYPLASLHRAGIRVIAGSDSPVEDPNPWRAMASAVSHTVTPVESLSGDQAFAAYLDGGLATGAPATFSVVDREPATTPDLAGTRVLAWFSEGERHDWEPLPWPAVSHSRSANG